MDIEIRKVTKDESRVILEWRLKFMSDTYKKEMTDEFASYTLKYIEENIDTDKFIVYIAKDNSKIVGSVIIAIYDVMPKLLNSTGRVGYIFNVSTLKEYRGQGIATKLLKQTLEEAKRIGAKEVYLNSEPDAINLYKSVGFEMAEREMVIRF